MTSTAFQVLLALVLLQDTVAFAPWHSLAAAAALKPRAQTARPATTLEQRPAATASVKLPQMRPDEAFTGVVECPFTAWGAGNDVNLEAERAIPRLLRLAHINPTRALQIRGRQHRIRASSLT